MPLRISEQLQAKVQAHTKTTDESKTNDHDATARKPQSHLAASSVFGSIKSPIDEEPLSASCHDENENDNFEQSWIDAQNLSLRLNRSTVGCEYASANSSVCSLCSSSCSSCSSLSSSTCSCSIYQIGSQTVERGRNLHAMQDCDLALKTMLYHGDSITRQQARLMLRRYFDVHGYIHCRGIINVEDVDAARRLVAHTVNDDSHSEQTVLTGYAELHESLEIRKLRSHALIRHTVESIMLRDDEQPPRFFQRPKSGWSTRRSSSSVVKDELTDFDEHKSEKFDDGQIDSDQQSSSRVRCLESTWIRCIGRHQCTDEHSDFYKFAHCIVSDTDSQSDSMLLKRLHREKSPAHVLGATR